MKIGIAWTNDCQGKKDYDGSLVRVSTRYWPGPVTVFDSRTPEKGLHEIDGGKPSAHSSIIFSDGAEDGGGETEYLVDRHFDGPTFEDVSAQVEAWAQQQMDRIAKALRAEFCAV